MGVCSCERMSECVRLYMWCSCGCVHAGIHEWVCVCVSLFIWVCKCSHVSVRAILSIECTLLALQQFSLSLPLLPSPSLSLSLTLPISSSLRRSRSSFCIDVSEINPNLVSFSHCYQESSSSFYALLCLHCNSLFNYIPFSLSGASYSLHLPIPL